MDLQIIILTAPVAGLNFNLNRDLDAELDLRSIMLVARLHAEIQAQVEICARIWIEAAQTGFADHDLHGASGPQHSKAMSTFACGSPDPRRALDQDLGLDRVYWICRSLPS